MKNYRQCRLRHENTHTTAWIESRGAKVGASVEIPATGRTWEVLEVFGPTLSEDVLKKMQWMHRKSLPSVEGVG